jgi:hypothetical protein
MQGVWGGLRSCDRAALHATCSHAGAMDGLLVTNKLLQSDTVSAAVLGGHKARKLLWQTLCLRQQLSAQPSQPAAPAFNVCHVNAALGMKSCP